MRGSLRKALLLLLLFTPLFGWDDARYRQVEQAAFRDTAAFAAAIDHAAVDYRLLHAAIFYVTNEERLKRRLPALTHHPALELAAHLHSRAMVTDAFFSHRNSRDATRRDPADRARLAGIANARIAENIANSFAIRYQAGRPVYPRGERGRFSYTPDGELLAVHSYLSLAETVVAQWMASPGHRANILSEKGLQLGCGAWFIWEGSWPKFIVTQKFQWFEPVKDGPAADRWP